MIIVKISLSALAALLMPIAATAQQPSPCDLLRTALAGNDLINSKQPKAAPPNMTWPGGSTIVGGGRYMVDLFSGIPSSGDLRKMEQAIGGADRQVAQCLPTAKRIITSLAGADREIRYCMPGSQRSVAIASSSGSRMISAQLTVEVPYAKACP